MLKTQNKNKGISLVEVVVASTIFLSIILAMMSTYSTYIKYSLSNQNNTRAGYLLEEGAEVITYLRDEGWGSNISSLVNGTTYYLFFDAIKWLSTTTPIYIDEGIKRTFVVQSVNRDSNDDIAISGVNDPNTKRFDITVSYWQGHSTSTESLSFYLTNIHNN